MKPKPPALAVEAALTDARIHRHADKMANLHEQLKHRASIATSPLERAKLLKAAYDVSEVGGALRYSGVTGADDSDLPH